jgi:phosphoglycerate dehydrogenase-like enzyme
MSRLKGIFVLHKEPYETIYPPELRGEISKLVEIFWPSLTKEEAKEKPEALRDVEVLFSGWGAPLLDEAFLRNCPNLKVVFYGAGSVKGLVTESFWERRILLVNARMANARSVAEFTLSQILFGLKHGWRMVRQTRQGNSRSDVIAVATPGNYGTVVGLVSLGAVGRCVLDFLQQFDHKRLVCDPYIAEEEIRRLGAEPSSLEELFRVSDLVSLHTPRLEETIGMIRGHHFAAMKEGATFLNTARGAVVNEPEMIEVLQGRPDLTAILDVTWPEPPGVDSPLYTMENVVVTPHVAGVYQSECRRMGEMMLAELCRYLKDQPLKWVVTREDLLRMA